MPSKQRRQRYQLAFTWFGTIDQRAGSIRLYVDGSLVRAGAVPTSASVAAATTPISIGARESGWVTGNDLQLSAAIDEVALYNYPLSATQVGAHFGLKNSFSGVPIILDPTGAIYTGASASSVFSSNYIAAKFVQPGCNRTAAGREIKQWRPGNGLAALGTSPAYGCFSTRSGLHAGRRCSTPSASAGSPRSTKLARWISGPARRVHSTRWRRHERAGGQRAHHCFKLGDLVSLFAERSVNWALFPG